VANELTGLVRRALNNIRTKAGTLTSNATIAKWITLLRTKTGVLTSNATLEKLSELLRTNLGTLTLVGSFSRLLSNFRTRTGEITFLGSVSRGILPFSKTIIGSLLTSGEVITVHVLRYLQNKFTQVLSFSGIVNGIKSSAGAFVGTCASALSSSGFISRLLSKLRSYSGVVSIVGVCARGISLLSRIYSSSISLSGTAGRLLSKFRMYSGTVSFGGIYSRGLSLFRGVYSGSLSLSGQLSNAISQRLITRIVSGIVSFAGQVSGILYTGTSGVLSLSGSFVRRLVLAREKVSTLSISGSLSKQFSCFERYVGYLSLNSILEFVKTGGAAAISVLENGLISITGTSSRRVQLAMAYSGSTSFSAGYTHQSGFFRELFSGVHPYAADIGGGAGVTGGKFMMDMTLGV